MLHALEAQDIEVVDGQQAMLDAREIKTADEIDSLKVQLGWSMQPMSTLPDQSGQAPANQLVAIAHDRLFRLGSERVECVNSVSGPRGKPDSHTFSDRIIQPGDMVFLDIMHSFNGYRTCYSGTFICDKRNNTRSKPTDLLQWSVP